MKFNGSGSDRFGGDPFKQHEQEMGKNALAIVGKQFESVFNLCIVLFIRQIPFQVVLTKCDYQMVKMFCKMKMLNERNFNQIKVTEKANERNKKNKQAFFLITQPENSRVEKTFNSKMFSKNLS